MWLILLQTQPELADSHLINAAHHPPRRSIQRRTYRTSYTEPTITEPSTECLFASCLKTRGGFSVTLLATSYEPDFSHLPASIPDKLLMSTSPDKQATSVAAGLEINTWEAETKAGKS